MQKQITPRHFQLEGAGFKKLQKFFKGTQTA